MEKTYTISEVADKLGLSTKTLRRWEESGKFTGSRTLGGQRRYSLTDLQVLDAIKHGSITGSDDLLTIKQAAALFGVTELTITRWEDEGKIHPLITAGVTYYPRHRLLAKLESLRPETPLNERVSEDYRDSAPLPPILPTPQPPISTPTPLFSPQGRTISFTLPTLPKIVINKTIPLNLLLTIIIVALYHLLIGRSLPLSTPGTNSAQVTSLARDPSLIALDSILDKTGNLKSRSLTTTSLSLSPASPPAGSPGSLYFDASTQTLKLYTNRVWQDLTAPTNSVEAEGASFTTGSATVPNGKDQVNVTVSGLQSTSQLILTFISDYSPARKYWVTVGSGYFTVHTDFPVGQDSPFTYLIANPK